MKIGLVGCGAISQTYLEAISEYPDMEVLGCADLVHEAAQARADSFGIKKVFSVSELLSDPDIELVLNLTVPRSHFAVSKASLEHGKHVYSEKPLATTVAEGHQLLDLAMRKKLKIGTAPDTFMGSAIQTARSAIDKGEIGDPHAGHGAMISRGMEMWHPNPEFYYESGGGPVFDMGPYYLSALLYLMKKPVKRVSACTAVTFPTRTITTKEKYGKEISVEVPTHVAAVMELRGGGVIGLTMSFDIWGSEIPRLEVYGATGSLSVPDPNGFEGDVRILRGGKGDWETVPTLSPYQNNRRGIGLHHMIDGIRSGNPYAANAEMGLHVLEIMEGIHLSANQGRHIEIKTNPPIPQALNA